MALLSSVNSVEAYINPLHMHAQEGYSSRLSVCVSSCYRSNCLSVDLCCPLSESA